MQIINYIESKNFISYRRGEELLMNCPLCDDKEKKFSINVVTGLWQCFHKNKCGKHGHFNELQKLLGDQQTVLENRGAYIGQTPKTYSLPDPSIPQMSNAQVPVYKWLKARGFTDETVKHFKIGAKENTVIFPYFKNGVLVNVKNRDIIDKKKMSMHKDGEHVLFNRDNIATNDTLVICEGELDCMALYQYGIDGVSVPNGCTGLGWVENEWDYIETFKKVHLCFDNDTAGKAGATALANRLGVWRCSIISLPCKDLNECLINNISQKEVLDLIENAKSMKPDTVMSPLHYEDKIKYLFAMGTSLFGIPTAWKDLTDLLKGWRGSEVTVLTGRNSSGKSTFLNQHCIDLVRKGEKIGIYSGEMPPDRYLRWAIIQLQQTPTPDKKQIHDALEWMDGRFYILDITNSIEPSKLLSDFEYMARRYGVKQFVVDSMMKIRLTGADEYRPQAEFVDALTSFVKKFNAHIYLVAHPRKTQSDDDIVGKVDVKGSSHITDLVDNVLVLTRPSEDMKEKRRKRGKTVADMHLFVKKNREFGTEGVVDSYFNPDTRLFSTLGE